MTMRVAMIGPLYLSYILIASAIPMPEQPNIQAKLSATSGAEDLLPTPFKEQKDLGNGVQEITLKAMAPLPVAAHGTARGMKGSYETTFMVCQTFDLHELAASHITKFDPIISKKAGAPGDGTIVHHIDLFMCDSRAEGIFKREGGRCDSFPDDGRMLGKRGSKEWENIACREFVYAYDRGAGAIEFPDKYGVRVGAGTPWHYVVMQRHLLIDPKMKGDFMEDSGVKMTLTTHLREQNLGIAGILDYALHIPGGKSHYDYTFTCPPSTVEKVFAPDNDSGGIRPVALHLHMHDRGRKMVFEVIRDGKVVTTIGRDDNYGGYGPSENYHVLGAKPAAGIQFSSDAKTVKGSFADSQLIKKGDSLRVTCTYDTANPMKLAPTSYGIDWHDEMCGPLMYYAPHDPNKRRKNAYGCEGSFGNEAINLK